MKISKPTHCAVPLVIAACLMTAHAVSPRALAQDAAQAAGEEKKVLVPGKWYPSLEAGLAFTQGAYTDNWSGGDQGSIIWTLLANSALESQLNGKANWKNTLKLAFGQTHQQQTSETGARSWEIPQKSTDQIDFESILRLTLGGFVDPFTSVGYQSQFLDASDPDGRRLAFNPMLFKESAGVARQLIKTEDKDLLSRFGFTFRQNARRSFSEPAPSTATLTDNTNDGGLEWVTDYKAKTLQDRVAWTSKLLVYQPVFYSGKSDLEDLAPAFLDSAGIDADVAELSTRVSADWENIFTSQITKLISVSLYTRWIYDAYDNSVKPMPGAEPGSLENQDVVRRAVRKAGQFKETLSIGVTYRFL